jgi:hypothetical protein
VSSTAAAILARGKGTRMDILCRSRPKPALPFAGHREASFGRAYGVQGTASQCEKGR